MKVAVIGTGYVGLTTGVCLAYIGHEVSCLDVDQAKVDALSAGHLPIYEPNLDHLLEAARSRMRFTSRYEDAIPEAEVVFIAVGTPSLPDGQPDLQYLGSASQSIGQHLASPFTVVVNKSTVPIGSGNWVGALIRESQKACGKSAEFAVASNPEFLREGSAIFDSLYPDRIVIGADSSLALEHLYRLYRPVIDQSFPAPAFELRREGFSAVPLVSTDLASAELIKYAANAFLATKISFINEVGVLASRVGADIQHVARGIGLDARIGNRFLNAGLGWGGSCFAKDTAALVSTAGEYGLTMPIVAAARQVNAQMRVRVIERLLETLKILKGRTITILGLAFKPHTDDLRDAPAIDIIRRLQQRGAIVKAHDPIAMDRFRKEHPDLASILTATPEAAVAESDAVVLATEWNLYRDLDWAELARTVRQKNFLDARLAMNAEALENCGWTVTKLP
ncbi:UDP-glucose dehydrogenase family protein [Bryobacter aggregatus]|uniref:UDP-glucose dehydrogenase family protein n=1 Tax=Bryobacter aggregatus TaxID=360054 RepID=UPI0004E194F5|nr:UDP-glucose/GDP-mannose dehydrogenase family protein [Bryobacter aggregatus]